MKKEKILEQLLNDKRIFIVVIVLAILGVFVLINNFRVLTDIFKTDDIENQIVGEYINKTTPDENEVY